jgi:RNA polymerase sigma factor (sigma-70 family)
VARARHGATLRQIQTLFNVGTVGGLTDGQLLERFTAGTGEAAELAFAALIERHGPMVLRVCQSVLREPHDAQDAFQATFLVLVRKAGSIHRRDSLSSWLHGVACRTAACAKAATARRARHERKAAVEAVSVVADGDPDDLASVLHEELDRLPEKYRAPIVLCYLESLTHEQAAQRLRWPVGTVRSRLARGREQLRGRLMRRGLALSVGLLEGALVAETARAALPAALPGVIAEAAVRYASGRLVATGVASASVAFLAEGAMKTLFLAKWKFAVLAAGLIASGAAVVAQRVGTENDAAAEDAAVARELHRLDLDLLAEEVQQLRDQVEVTFRAKLRAEKRFHGTVGEGPDTQAKRVKEAQSAYAEARAAYLAKARELRSERRRLAVAPAPSMMWPLVLPGSTALDPARLARIRARFAPARVIQIAQVQDRNPKTGQPEFRDLRPGDRVSKGDLLGVFSSVDVASKKTDLLQALVQLELDQKILNRLEQNRHSVPEVHYLNQVRAVQGDRTEIDRALLYLKTWDIPQEEIDALRAEAKTITADKDAWLQTPEGRWVKRSREAQSGKVDPGRENEGSRGRVTLRAPFDGVLIERNVGKDDLVVDNTVILFQIADVSRLLVIAHCPAEALTPLSSLGQNERRWTVRTVGAPTSNGLPGTIADIGYIIDPNQHTAIIKGYVENPGQQIRVGQHVTVTINGP